MDWENLRTFLVAARHDTLTGAAESLRLSVATVARRIGQLEQEIGVSLFKRGPKGLVLTAEGGALVARARDGEQQWAEVERFAGGLSGNIRPGHIRISATEPVVSAILAPNIPAARLAMPTVRIDLLVHSAIVSLALDDADLAIRLVRPSGNSLMATRLPKLEMGLFAAQTYQPASTDFSDLSKEQWLGYDDSYGDIAEVRWIREQGLTDSQVLRTSSTRALVNACAAGAGIAILPRVMTRGHSELIALQLGDPVPARSPWLVWRSGELEGKRLRKARQWVVESFAKAVSA